MVIEHEQNGLLIPVGDETALYNALCQMHDKNLRKIYGENAKQTAQEFAPKVIFEKWKTYVFKIAR